MIAICWCNCTVSFAQTFTLAPPLTQTPVHTAKPVRLPLPDDLPRRSTDPPNWGMTASEPRNLIAAVSPPVTTPAVSQRSQSFAMTTHFELPRAIEPTWWSAAVAQPVGVGRSAMPIRIGELVQSALSNSVQIQALLSEPQIRRAAICVEQAQFDWGTFVESRFDDTSDPIGSILQTGSENGRFVDQTWSAKGGLRQSNRLGGQTELTQNAGHQFNNSQFLVPNPQGTTRLEFSYTQPLLNGSGRFINESQIVLAKIDLQATDYRTAGRIQDHLIEVTNAYWDLYLGRSQLVQRRKLLYGAVQIYNTLKAREGIDVLKRQLLRAHVAVAGREAEVIRAQTEIRNAQSRLRRLVNDPQLMGAKDLEWIPQDVPLPARVDVSATAAAQLALASRPEINESMRRVKALSVQAQVAKYDLLPRLDLLLRTYVSGLKGDRDTLGSWSRQFNDGRPTYGVGMLYEFPLGNRAAEARLSRSRWELSREMHQFESTVEQTLLEVDVAVRETHTAYQEMVSKQRAVFAAEAEVSYLDDRWRTLPTQQDAAILLLENLLDAQQRLGSEEAALVTANVNYAKSWTALRRSMGTLLHMETDPILVNGSQTGMGSQSNMRPKHFAEGPSHD